MKQNDPRLPRWLPTIPDNPNDFNPENNFSDTSQMQDDSSSTQHFSDSSDSTSNTTSYHFAEEYSDLETNYTLSRFLSSSESNFTDSTSALSSSSPAPQILDVEEPNFFDGTDTDRFLTSISSPFINPTNSIPNTVVGLNDKLYNNSTSIPQNVSGGSYVVSSFASDIPSNSSQSTINITKTTNGNEYAIPEPKPPGCTIEQPVDVYTIVYPATPPPSPVCSVPTPSGSRCTNRPREIFSFPRIESRIKVNTSTNSIENSKISGLKNTCNQTTEYLEESYASDDEMSTDENSCGGSESVQDELRCQSNIEPFNFIASRKRTLEEMEEFESSSEEEFSDSN